MTKYYVLVLGHVLNIERRCSAAARSIVSTSRMTDGPSKVTLDFNHGDAVAILTLSNPTRRNALTYHMMEQLDDHVTELERWSKDESLKNNARAIVLTGANGTFCSGLDLHDQASSSHPFQSGSQMNLHMTQVTNRLHSLPVPSISAIDGYAVGGGGELSTCTDFVVLSINARVQFVHVQRGASPGWGGGRRLVNRVGRRKALSMLLFGSPVLGSKEAETLCYADGVGIEGEKALDAAMRLIVNPILDLPCPKSVRAVKSVVSAADGDRDVLELEGKTMLYTTNKALATERTEFMRVWGGESNLKQIAEAKARLQQKKRPS